MSQPGVRDTSYWRRKFISASVDSSTDNARIAVEIRAVGIKAPIVSRVDARRVGGQMKISHCEIDETRRFREVNGSYRRGRRCATELYYGSGVVEARKAGLIVIDDATRGITLVRSSTRGQTAGANVADDSTIDQR